MKPKQKQHPVVDVTDDGSKVRCCKEQPGEDWEIDFTHMPKANGYSCLQVWVDTFTGWIEAFPCHSE